MQLTSSTGEYDVSVTDTVRSYWIRVCGRNEKGIQA